MSTIRRNKPFKKGETLWGKVIEVLVLQDENDLNTGIVIHRLVHDCLITVTGIEDDGENQSVSFRVERMEKPEGES